MEIDKFGQILPTELERLKQMLPAPSSALPLKRGIRHKANAEKADKTVIKAHGEPLDEISTRPVASG